MRIVFAGGTICDYHTLQRLVLIADEIGFMDRPAIKFGDWGMVGHETQARQFDTSDAPITFSSWSTPSGPASELYQHYLAADLNNPRFIEAFLDGLRNDRTFQARFIQLDANYRSGTGREVLNSLLRDSTLGSSPLMEPVNGQLLFKMDTAGGRRETLKILLIEASVHVTNALVVAEEAGLVPVSDDPYFCRLLALRTVDSWYVGGTSRLAPFLGLAIAKSVLPDGLLDELQIADLFSYRRSTKEAYESWSADIDRLAARLAEAKPEKMDREIARLLNTEIGPKLVEYRHDMKAARDKLFGDLIKKVTVWEVPTLSLAYLTSLDIPSAMATFAGALAPALPPVVDYFLKRRDVKRRNSMAYLIGVSPAEPDYR